MHPEPTIVIVCYQSGELLQNSAWQAFFSSTPSRVMVVDNCSPDASVERIRAAYPRLEIVPLAANLGYGGAANRGFAQCEGRFALLLNPDLTVTTEQVDALAGIALGDSEDVAIWAPALHQASWIEDGVVDVEQVSGAAMLIRLEVINRLGGFDENIFLYSEESDLCLRAKKAGYRIKYCPQVLMEHLGDRSSGTTDRLVYGKHYHFAWSRCYFLTKHGLAVGKRNPRRMLFTYRLKRMVSTCFDKKLEYRGKADGVRDFLRNRRAFDDNGRPRHM